MKRKNVLIHPALHYLVSTTKYGLWFGREKKKGKRKEIRGRTKEKGEVGKKDKNNIKSSHVIWCLQLAGDGEYHQSKSLYIIFKK